jgi:rRNA processing protein Krr1/Pno1
MITERTRRIEATSVSFDLDDLIAALLEVKLHAKAVGIDSPQVLLHDECALEFIDLCEMKTFDTDEGEQRWPVIVFRHK